MQQQAECIVCGNAAFDLLDGLYFCSECGTQSQDVREEVTETTAEAGDSVGFRRLIRSSTKKKDKQDVPGDSPSVKGEGGSLSQLEIFQLILQKQCDAMVSLGVDPSIREAVKLLWFHYLKYYGYAFTDTQADKNTPGTSSRQQASSSPRTPSASKKKGRSKTTPLIISSKMKTPQDKCEGDEGGATPKKRGKGRPRKAISELLSKSGRRRRRDELTQSSQGEGDGATSSAGSSSGSGVAERKRRREGSGESSTSKAKRIKVEEKEEDREEIFDVFPSDEHLFTPFDSDSADSAGKDSNSSWSDSDGELRGTKLYLKRRRETQLVTGNPMLSYFSLKYTMCLCYLGLLYINQNILLSDLVRWTLLNKVPYHNFASIFPRSITSSTNIQVYMAIVPLTSDRVYYLARALHSHLKLPPISSIDPSPVCHAIIDRLCLSPCFHSILDKALLNVHRPSFEDSFRRIDLRFDGECLALVLFLVRLIYQLDDVYEFEQPSYLAEQTAAGGGSFPPSVPHVPEDQPGPSTSAKTSSTRHPASTGLSSAAVVDTSTSVGDGGDQSRVTVESCLLYPWEDWVVVYLHHMRRLFGTEVPTNERELEYVTNYQTYVDFCHAEIFQATRPTPQNWFRRSVYNPEYYAKLSEIFKRYHTKVEQSARVSIKSEDGSDSGSEDAPRASGINEGDQLPPFTPRQISLQRMLGDPRAPWKYYRPLRGPQSFQGVRHTHLAGIDLSHSLLFLMNAGAQLIDIRPEEVYEQILRVESSFINTAQKELKKLDSFMASCKPKP